RQASQPAGRGHRHPPLAPAFGLVRLHPLVVPVPHVAAALDLHIGSCIVGITVLVTLCALAITERPELHALHHAPVAVAENSVVAVKLVRALIVVVAVNPEYAQHVQVVPVPAVIDPVVEWRSEERRV